MDIIKTMEIKLRICSFLKDRFEEVGIKTIFGERTNELILICDVPIRGDLHTEVNISI